MEGLILYLHLGTNPCVCLFWSMLFMGGRIGHPLFGITERGDLLSTDLILCSFVIIGKCYSFHITRQSVLNFIPLFKAVFISHRDLMPW